MTLALQMALCNVFPSFSVNCLLLFLDHEDGRETPGPAGGETPALPTAQEGPARGGEETEKRAEVTMEYIPKPVL